MTELKWTSEIVKDWFEDSIRTMRKLPKVTVQGYKCAWPAIKYTEFEILQMDKKPIKLRPSNFDLARSDVVLDMIFLVKDKNERFLIWSRAKRLPWKIIAVNYQKNFKKMLSRVQLWRIYENAIEKLVSQMNNTKNPLYYKSLPLLREYKKPRGGQTAKRD